MANEKKVRYGVRNVHYAALNDDGTYGEIKPLKGAVSLTRDPQGDEAVFYADDEKYFVESNNTGYTGDLEIAFLDDAQAKDLLGEVEDANGVMYEDAKASIPEVALMWEFEGSPDGTRGVFHKVKFSRPSVSGSTTTESKEPGTTTLSYTATPREIEVGDETKYIAKATMTQSKDATVYKNWFDEVYIPQEAASGPSTPGA